MSHARANMLLAVTVLAQTSEHTWRIFWSVLGLVVAVIVLAAVALLVRRFMLGKDTPAQSPGFSLAEMRRLRDAGELSDEEYERIRETLVTQARSALDTPAAPETSAGRNTPEAPGASPKPEPPSNRKNGKLDDGDTPKDPLPPEGPEDPDAGKPR